MKDVMLIGLSPRLTGRAARCAKQQKARTPPTDGSGNSSTSPRWGSAVHSARSLAYEPISLFPNPSHTSPAPL